MTDWWVRSLAAFALGLSLCALPATAQERVLDAFEALDGWRAVAADGVSLDLSLDEGLHGQALRMDVDYDGAGYAIAMKDFPLDLPENYRFRFSLRAEGPGGAPAPVNDLEFKLVDPSGENVWWHNRRRLRFPSDWQRFTTRARHVEFAWGPDHTERLERLGHVEFVVTAVEGGPVTVWIDDFTFEPLPPDAPYAGTPTATASAGDASGLFASPATSWATPAGDQTLTVDFGAEREFGGFTLDWSEAPAAYTVELSDDGADWRTVYTMTGGRGGGRDWLPLPESEARYVRLGLTGSGATLRSFTVEPLAFAATPTALFEAIARAEPRGRYPRMFLGEQTFWTITGVDGDEHEALVGEDGAVEVRKGRFSVEPFLWRDGRLLGWAEADAITHALQDGYLPIPSVTRHYDGLTLTTTTFAGGEPGNAELFLRYRVENTGAESDSIRLFLTIRPFQVNPPAQFLNTPGGAGRIEHLAVDGAAVQVDDWHLAALGTPTAVGASSFDSGDVSEWLAVGTVPEAEEVTDPQGFASGALAFDLVVAPKETEEIDLVAPLGTRGARTTHRNGSVEERQGAVADEWRGKLDRVRFVLPSEAEAYGRALRSNLAYVLINRDGAGLQPGSRSYERSWIRDGSLTSSALLRMGYPEAARAFAEWYAPFQYPSGKVPCCVDRIGAGPVPENDSHGQLLFLIAEVYRFTHDDAFLRRMWPHVRGAVAYMDTLRAQRMTPEYRTDSLRAFYGLLPESISHEGYSAKPMHAFWDQLFALKGYRDAVFIAEALGEDAAAARFRAARDTFAADLAASYRRTMATHGIDYLPGSVELGDFDPTSVTIAMDPVDAGGVLPEGGLAATFDRYWDFFLTRLGSVTWRDYTPYEWRNVGALVRLGEKERALEVAAWLFSHRRPPEWNAFAEVVGRDMDAPRFVGDIPHTWVGSDFIRSMTDLFAYESGDAVVVGAGIPEIWLVSEAGVGVDSLRTPYGPLSYRLRAEDDTATFTLSAGLDVPAGGLVVHSPFAARSATVDGSEAPLTDDGAVVVRTLPARVVFRR